MKKYIWCEDARSGYEFWNIFFSELAPDAVVESKRNNSELRKAVSQINNEEDKYYILIDNAIDNPNVLRELNRIKKDAESRKNVEVIGVHSFEFALLSFTLLEKWIFAENDDLKDKRTSLLELKNIFVNIVCDGGDASELRRIISLLSYSDSFNSEQISSKLLSDITRNTGFETNKGKLGECFKLDCCDWNERQSDDICGLDSERFSLHDKMQIIFDNSILKNTLNGVLS